jgi:hypothetical protein
MQAGLFVIAMLVGFGAAIGVILNGSSWWMGLFAYSIAGAVAMVVVPLVVCGLCQMARLITGQGGRFCQDMSGSED